MSLKRLHPGKRMSQGVVRGDIVFLAGQVAETKGGAPVAEQTKEVLGQIDKLLAEAGTDKTKIMMATIYLADIKTFAEMNSAWDAWVPQGATPARATVEAKLAAPEYKVEVVIVAAI
ncbi:Enamine deaminase RidA, house cleaning of reactive enamine intermediates, YjgF/YER057c/UK114 family [Rhodoblastus acidophilus]|uniref:Enamine deaminase RidA, house cleaning of reactive enamine intermediates, YjgF/YER057c/UK114 family n=1 Tax=Rhodoblastus acidophilus TaxID=1074 RepID=A0A212R1A3_RHOAC|nr:RidA family protein [Rhodoblastus acidophilus]MCW2314585.1 enamine deaminase RidA (YjgF/YER057c/UK114 family) [Rhodoblastus acidophilus]PPQ40390.1 RidA family protein [Rhodoblastus acidophilus]RAI22284.1 RidA family protein [Rhodoblastus acidophilus]SNB65782.1 Enamine deaminase RidA, house cleaning of reactive enamine intermediates, YjgF/YER057c/UK114 family [Rhodoblastus acidophilus]